jgi:hypothetical protein
MTDPDILISIDPGATVGIAAWDRGSLSFVASYGFGSKGFDLLLTQFGAYRAVIEMPDHLAAKTENVLTCAWRAGYCARAFAQHKMIKVGEWKGSVPKEVTKRRAEKVLEPDELRHVDGKNHHAWDAIGIGLFELGRLKR